MFAGLRGLWRPKSHMARPAGPSPDSNPDQDPGPARAPGQPSEQQIREAQDRFIAAWGQMGSAWGISRTQAEVHALLYIAGEPLSAEEIMERLEISRGN